MQNELIYLKALLFFSASECSICGRMVSNMKVHLRHHAAKINNLLVNCPMCEKKIGKYQLIRHIKAVHQKEFQTDRSKLNIKVYTCSICDDYFSRKQELRQHEYLNHSQNSKIYECKICGNVFRKLKLLNVHRFSHQPLNIKCELCNNVYSRRSALWKHQKVEIYL
jgi:C2H2-type zinc finger/Zinc finger, C2H2 type